MSGLSFFHSPGNDGDIDHRLLNVDAYLNNLAVWLYNNRSLEQKSIYYCKIIHYSTVDRMLQNRILNLECELVLIDVQWKRH